MQSRGGDVIREVIKDHRSKVWVSDLFSTQKTQPAVDWQVCLAHQLRDCQYGIDAGDEIFPIFRRCDRKIQYFLEMRNIEASNIRVQDIDHCGLIADICDEMGLVEQIDQLLGTHPQSIITPRQAVKAMILNGLGFVSAPLYLFEKFFFGKATEHLLGEGIRPEHLNDDRLGRILDKLYAAGVTELFVTVALSAARTLWCRLAQPTPRFEFPTR
jgi:hypothetical protein